MPLNTRRLPRPDDPRYISAVGSVLVEGAIRAYYRKQGYEPPAKGGLTVWQIEDREKCRTSFIYFLRYWKFKNRESGEICSFEVLWEGQRLAAEQMEAHPWLFLLKAGKLGFTELECAFDAWKAIFSGPNTRIHLFSKDLIAARELLGMVKFGIMNLPEHIAPRIISEKAGGSTTTSLMLTGDGPDDERIIISYAATENAAINQSAMHTHLDEMSHMRDPKAVWDSVATTVTPDGTIHIVTRGAGNEVYTRDLWDIAVARGSKLVPFFAPYNLRPGRDAEWRAREAATMHDTALRHWAPETPEDALAGDADAMFVPMALWNACYDPELPPLDASTPLVLAIDAAVSSDYFVISGVTRHPKYHEQAAHRFLYVYKPDLNGFIDYGVVFRYILDLCKQYKVVCIVYDLYQMVDMGQRLVEAGIWAESFSQQGPRLEADGGLHHAILSREFWHMNEPELNAAVEAAGVQIDEKNRSRLRIVKRHPAKKIDALVATSMARHMCLYLNL